MKDHIPVKIKKGIGPFLNLLLVEQDHLLMMKTSEPFACYSSGLLGAGVCRTNTFYNRFVHKDYACNHPIEEYRHYLKSRELVFEGVVGLMTAVPLKNRILYTYEYDNLTIISVITAGVGNAVDITSDELTPFSVNPGTINMFFFIDGWLSEAAFLQVFIAATEAKTKTLGALNVRDPNTNSIATGTSTDSICVAARQKGHRYEYAGSMTALGQGIAKLVKISLDDALRERVKK
ncbi:adenosylcobinamide amidohydrolase [Metabacillus iocasae]|uniref:Iron complex transport system ATP-binding protein n=1 Tax=Priestia iocasae TaxID=2291674 RepID=A0ABS2QRZ6_9BACI|nr:adenosylcobinamide amidohydrolase [Metabacillus iocasae]MBM7701988.1 iron complex transport system ATP-binding protein [Metabacillus iocasae]